MTKQAIETRYYGPTNCRGSRNGGAIVKGNMADAQVMAAAFDMLAAIDSMLAELDNGNDFAAWESAKQQMRNARALAVQS